MKSDSLLKGFCTIVNLPVCYSRVVYDCLAASTDFGGDGLWGEET